MNAPSIVDGICSKIHEPIPRARLSISEGAEE
jgi:hypothetical protein